MPKIITGDEQVNINAIKSYFCSEYVLMMIANMAGFNYDQLISGSYKLLLEPIAYFTVGGIMAAMTAHEAALYDQLIGGTLKSHMPSLTHKNLLLAMFLETSDLGFPAWKGSTTEKVSDDEIISSLGLGVVRFSQPNLSQGTVP